MNLNDSQGHERDESQQGERGCLWGKQPCTGEGFPQGNISTINWLPGGYTLPRLKGKLTARDTVILTGEALGFQVRFQVLSFIGLVNVPVGTATLKNSLDIPYKVKHKVTR